MRIAFYYFHVSDFFLLSFLKGSNNVNKRPGIYVGLWNRYLKMNELLFGKSWTTRVGRIVKYLKQSLSHYFVGFFLSITSNRMRIFSGQEAVCFPLKLSYFIFGTLLNTSLVEYQSSIAHVATAFIYLTTIKVTGVPLSEIKKFVLVKEQKLKNLTAQVQRKGKHLE